jgi:hypothetical protein
MDVYNHGWKAWGWESTKKYKRINGTIPVTRSPSIAEINSDFSLRYPYVPIPQPSIPEAHDQQNPPPSSPSLALTAYPTPTASEAIQALSLFARKHKAVVDLDKGSNKDSAQTRDPISVAQIEAEYQRDISGRQACDLVPDGAFRGGSWHWQEELIEWLENLGLMEQWEEGEVAGVIQHAEDDMQDSTWGCDAVEAL